MEKRFVIGRRARLAFVSMTLTELLSSPSHPHVLFAGPSCSGKSVLLQSALDEVEAGSLGDVLVTVIDSKLGLSWSSDSVVDGLAAEDYGSWVEMTLRQLARRVASRHVDASQIDEVCFIDELLLTRARHTASIESSLATIALADNGGARLLISTQNEGSVHGLLRSRSVVKRLKRLA